MALKIDTSKLEVVEPKDTLPFFIKCKKMIFGKNKPDAFTRLVFYVNLVAWFLFMIWSIISYLTIALRDLIKENKNISVSEIVRKRGEALGFDGETFLVNFRQFQFIDMFIWAIVFLSIVLLYRKKKLFALVFFSAIGLHFLLMLFMLSLRYFIEDISFFDKIAYTTILVLNFIYTLLLFKEKNQNINA